VTGPEILRLPGDRASIRGTLPEVGAALEVASRSGRLVAATDPVPMPGEPGVVLVHVRFAPPPRRPLVVKTRRRTRPGVVAVAVAGVLGVLGVVVWAVATLIAWVVAHWLTVLGVLAGGWLVLTALGRAGVCPGIHCPGCSHR
jgi:hypothetical protein